MISGRKIEKQNCHEQIICTVLPGLIKSNELMMNSEYGSVSCVRKIQAENLCFCQLLTGFCVLLVVTCRTGNGCYTIRGRDA